MRVTDLLDVVIGEAEIRVCACGELVHHILIVGAKKDLLGGTVHLDQISSTLDVVLQWVKPRRRRRRRRRRKKRKRKEKGRRRNSNTGLSSMTTVISTGFLIIPQLKGQGIT